MLLLLQILHNNTNLIVGIVIGLLITKIWQELSSQFGRAGKQQQQQQQHVVANEKGRLVERIIEFLEHIDTYSHDDSNSDKVVEYKSPNELLHQLPWLTLSSRTNTTNNNNTIIGSMDLLQTIIEQILHFSVRTCNKRFLNQLFGPADRLSVLADIITAITNTSVYTYETAPVYTMMESEVVHFLGNLVYGDKNNNGEQELFTDTSCCRKQNMGNEQLEDNNNIDGIFVPGGSLGNLMGLNCARYYHQSQVNRIGFLPEMFDSSGGVFSSVAGEEKKEEDTTSCEEYIIRSTSAEPTSREHLLNRTRSRSSDHCLVALVNREAHYSFLKGCNIIGVELELIDTNENGEMDPKSLREKLHELYYVQNKRPFIVGLTSGTTVRGAFDNISDCITIVREFEASLRNSSNHHYKLWIHVDGALGGPCIFSNNHRNLLKGVGDADSFTINGHKLLGCTQQCTVFLTKRKQILKDANEGNAKYLFHPDKNGAAYDIGDKTFVCGRKPDCLKFWLLLKFYGTSGLGARVDHSIGLVSNFVSLIETSPCFVLACRPCPLNVNFFYLPPRYLYLKSMPISEWSSEELSALTDVCIRLKRAMHSAGVAMIPYQPVPFSGKDLEEYGGKGYQCLRVVFVGDRSTMNSSVDLPKLSSLIDDYGRVL